MFGPAGCSVLTLEWEEKQGSKPGEHKGGPFLGQPWTSLDPFCCFVLPPSVPRLKVPLGRAHTPIVHTFTHSHFLMNFLRGISYSSGCPRVYSVANDDLELLALCLHLLSIGITGLWGHTQLHSLFYLQNHSTFQKKIKLSLW